MQITRIQTFIIPVLDYANNLMKILILGLGGYMLLKHQLTLGEITAFLSFLFGIAGIAVNAVR